MKKKSERQKWIDKCEDLIREQKFKLFGRKCQFCGKTAGLGLFHILGKGSHPRIRLHEDNILIAGWFCCHFRWHHDPYFARNYIFPKINAICGEGWEDYLLQLNRTEPKLGLMRIKEIYEELKEREK